jgi:hypothetical protein
MANDSRPPTPVPDSTERRRDKYGRRVYEWNETPPASVGLVVWRNKVTTDWPPTPSNSIGAHWHSPCQGGWMESGDWWLHCWVCRQPVAVKPSYEDIRSAVHEVLTGKPWADALGLDDIYTSEDIARAVWTLLYPVTEGEDQ